MPRPVENIARGGRWRRGGSKGVAVKAHTRISFAGSCPLPLCNRRFHRSNRGKERYWIDKILLRRVLRHRSFSGTIYDFRFFRYPSSAPISSAATSPLLNPFDGTWGEGIVCTSSVETRLRVSTRTRFYVDWWYWLGNRYLSISQNRMWNFLRGIVESVCRWEMLFEDIVGCKVKGGRGMLRRFLLSRILENCGKLFRMFR